jgi:outer membrane protein OmpU
MKKLLYGTSALVAAGLLSSGPALAADPISLSLGGNFAFAFGWVNEDDSTGQPGNLDRSHAFAESSEVIFSGNTTLDNGVAVTVQIELEGSTQGDQIDENFIRFSSDAMGSLELGGRDGAASKMLTLGPLVDFNHGVGVAEFTYVNFGTNDVGFIAPAGRSSDSLKITYFTPVISGFRLGISYEPEPGLDGLDGYKRGNVAVDTATDTATDTAASEFIELGVEFVNNFSDVSFRGSVLYAQGNQEGTAGAGQFLDDNTLWNVGVQLGFGAFTIGGAYQRAEQESGDRNIREEADNSYRISATFATGAWLLGAGYGNRQLDDNETATGAAQANLQDEASVWGLTAKRTLGPGVTVSAGLRVWDIEDGANAPAANNDATNVFLATRLAF